jgi:hypothetical protein
MPLNDGSLTVSGHCTTDSNTEIKMYMGGGLIGVVVLVLIVLFVMGRL